MATTSQRFSKATLEDYLWRRINLLTAGNGFTRLHDDGTSQLSRRQYRHMELSEMVRDKTPDERQNVAIDYGKREAFADLIEYFER